MNIKYPNAINCDLSLALSIQLKPSLSITPTSSRVSLDSFIFSLPRATIDT